MKHHKQLLFTFDYELFLGKRSGSVNKCLLLPTQKILDILNRHNIKGIFFIDTLYLIRLREIAVKFQQAHENEKRIEHQIQQMSKQGHYVFPHLHPHWLDAQYIPEINQWKFENFSNYRLHNIPITERENIFFRSMNVLNDIIKPVNKNYFPNGFRAGGWCIQPFEDFNPWFEKFSIKYDFSVMRKMKNFSKISCYDFSDMPQKDIYKFSNTITKEDENGTFTEFVISTTTFSKFNNLLNRILLKYLWKINNRSMGDGNAAIVNSDEQNHAKNNPEIVAIELLTLARLGYYFQYFQKHDFMHFISHPKMLSEHNLKTFEKFLQRITIKYEIETDFKQMTGYEKNP